MRLRILLLCLALVGATALLVLPRDEPAGDDSAGLRGAPQQQRLDDSSRRPGQTSEGVTGPMAEKLSPGYFPRPRISKQKSWTMAPGVRYRRWEQTDRRGRIRAHLLSIDLDEPGVTVDAVSGAYVPDREPVSTLVDRDRGLAGVNGGFFDIHDTGAPLGVGRDRQRGMLHASLGTWDKAFWIARNGTPRIGTAVLEATVDQLPQIEVTNVNGARVKIAGVGIYTPEWGISSGYRITDGQTKKVRQVVIKGGRVVSNEPRLTAGDPITDGFVLVGRGDGATSLLQMKVGSLASVQWKLRGRPTVAVGGEKILLRDGRRMVENNRELHPRTAIGIDRDRNRLLLLVIDGRQSFSRGYTMVELARLLKQLGAEDALNLDGGGSSTMVGHGRGGLLKVLNSPSDGSQRSVPEGIVVHYDKPKG